MNTPPARTSLVAVVVAVEVVVVVVVVVVVAVAVVSLQARGLTTRGDEPGGATKKEEEGLILFVVQGFLF